MLPLLRRKTIIGVSRNVPAPVIRRSINYIPPQPPVRLVPAKSRTRRILTGVGLIGLGFIAAQALDIIGDEEHETFEYVNASGGLDVPEELGFNWKNVALEPHAATYKLKVLCEEQTVLGASKDFPSSLLWGDVSRLPGNSPPEDVVTYESIPVKGDWQFFGVYDGHAGWETSEVLRHSLISYVARELQQLSQTDVIDSVHKAIKTAFLRLDDAIVFNGLNALRDAKSNAEAIVRIAPARSGSCALLATFDPSTYNLHVACVGDSRAVLGRGSQAIPLSEDQTGFNESEKARIANEHPGEDVIADGRLLGIAVTRAFGDVRWKWPLEALADCKERFWGQNPRPNYASPPYLTAEPEVKTIKIQSGDFLILASDGLWDNMSSEDAVKCVEMWVKAKTSGELETLSVTRLEESFVPDSPGKEAIGLPHQWKATPENFVVEDDSAATHLIKNALGGSRRDLFSSTISISPPDSRNVRDDMSVHVIFFDGPVYGWLDEGQKVHLDAYRNSGTEAKAGKTG